MSQKMMSDIKVEMERDLDRMVGLWKALVETDSGSAYKPGVDRVNEMVRNILVDLGFTCRVIRQEEVGNHLVAARTFGGRGRVLLSCHLDTVWPEGTAAEWPFRVQDGRATGPGVIDMKGGIVVMIEALRHLLASGTCGLERISVVGAGDEEFGSQTARATIESEAKQADWCFVMESAPPGDFLVTARRAVGNFRLRVEGRTAHCGTRYEDGVSAVRELAHKILAFEALNNPEEGIIVSAGLIRGGVARQVVPEVATAIFDVRTRTRAQQEQLTARMTASAAQPTVPGTRCVLEGEFHRPPFEESPGGLTLFELARETGRGLGMDLKGCIRGGGSDGSFAAALGVPTLDGLGPVGDHICSRREYGEVKSLPAKAALLAGLLRQLPERLL